ncbi:MAG: hypothetical protein C4321_10200, partial [Chloroflexota bacterium]
PPRVKAFLLAYFGLRLAAYLLLLLAILRSTLMGGLLGLIGFAGMSTPDVPLPDKLPGMSGKAHGSRDGG